MRRSLVSEPKDFGRVAVLMGGWVSRASYAERLNVAQRAANARGLVRGPDLQLTIHPFGWRLA